ncbi:MAG TPA: hypothetical protein VK558_18360 [Patescibacteria group bacterium]|nr:hypothetical protein [Patescibacteria group bacterium]
MTKKHQFNLMLGDRRLPVDIHALAVDSDGDVVGLGRQTFTFGFAYQSISYAAHYVEAGDLAHIDLVGQVGLLPFTAESLEARLAVSRILDAANSHLGPIFRLEDGRIELFGAAEVVVPVTAVGLVSALAAFLLRVKPYVDCIDIYLGPSAEGGEAGPRRLRPAYRRSANRRKR